MKKHLITCTLLAALGIMLTGCGTDSGSTPAPEKAPTETTDPAASVKPLPDNYADPTKPTLVPYYDLPAGWEISPSSKYMLRTEDRDPMAFLWLDLHDTDPDLRQAATKRQQRLTCVDGQSPYNAWQNCDRPIEREEITIGDQTVIHLRYWGSWRDGDMSVDEYLFMTRGSVYMFTLEAGNDQDLAAVKTILRTLEFRYEVFVPGVEDEELGGL